MMSGNRLGITLEAITKIAHFGGLRIRQQAGQQQSPMGIKNEALIFTQGNNRQTLRIGRWVGHGFSSFPDNAGKYRR